MAAGAMLIWVLIAVVVVIVIVIVVVVVTTRGRGEVRDRERAGELRARAANDDQLLDSRKERTETLEAQADAARQRAMTESERADSLRAQAGESDELAARASEKAEILDDDALHSRESLEESVEQHVETLREADRRDPDVPTDRHGNRVPDEDDEVDVVVIPENERLDLEDNYSDDEFGEPDAEYIDPVEHDRLDHLRDEPRVQQDPVVEAPEDQFVPDEPTRDDDGVEPELDLPVQGGYMDDSQSGIVLDDETPQSFPDTDAPAVDPYGNPVVEADTPLTDSRSDEEDLPRDEQGRRLDPYGNPVADDRDSQ